MFNEIKEIIISKREKRIRLRAIFRHLRGVSRFNGLSDITILNLITIGMSEINLPYSIKEIYSVFCLINKNDYDKSQKHELLKGYLKHASKLSIF